MAGRWYLPVLESVPGVRRGGGCMYDLLCNTCMYVCMHVCVYVCMYVCVCVYVCMDACMCAYVCVRMHVCIIYVDPMNVCMYMHTCMRANICIRYICLLQMYDNCNCVKYILQHDRSIIWGLEKSSCRV